MSTRLGGIASGPMARCDRIWSVYAGKGTSQALAIQSPLREIANQRRACRAVRDLQELLRRRDRDLPRLHRLGENRILKDANARADVLLTLMNCLGDLALRPVSPSEQNKEASRLLVWGNVLALEIFQKGLDVGILGADLSDDTRDFRDADE